MDKNQSFCAGSVYSLEPGMSQTLVTARGLECEGFRDVMPVSALFSVIAPLLYSASMRSRYILPPATALCLLTEGPVVDADDFAQP